MDLHVAFVCIFAVSFRVILLLQDLEHPQCILTAGHDDYTRTRDAHYTCTLILSCLVVSESVCLSLVRHYYSKLSKP